MAGAVPLLTQMPYFTDGRWLGAPLEQLGM